MIARLDDVSFAYPGADTLALREITLEVDRGEVTLVTGNLGAGCSTLLLALAGLVPHVTGGELRGRATTLGHDPGSADGRRALAGRIGLLLSTPWTQLSGMASTVREEVAFGPANLGWSRDRIAHAVDESLRAAGVATLGDRDPRTLSGGELQRVMYAGVLAMEPELLLLDEPAVELDPAGTRLLYGALREHARRAAVVIATTDVDRIADFVDRVVVLDAGTVVTSGLPRAVLVTERAVERGWSTTVAAIGRAAGLPAPYPLTTRDAVEVWR